MMLGEGGESRFDTNINFLLEEYGIMVNNGDYYLTTFYLFVCATVYIWGSEDNVGELVLSFRHVDFKVQTHAVRLGGKCIYSLNCHWYG